MSKMRLRFLITTVFCGILMSTTPTIAMNKNSINDKKNENIIVDDMRFIYRFFEEDKNHKCENNEDEINYAMKDYDVISEPEKHKPMIIYIFKYICCEEEDVYRYHKNTNKNNAIKNNDEKNYIYYEQQDGYKYCEKTNKYEKTDVDYYKIKKIPTSSECKNKCKFSTFQIFPDDKENLEPCVNNEKYVEFVLPAEFINAGEFNYNGIYHMDDYLIYAKNYFRKKNDGQIPEEIHITIPKDMSTESTPYDYIENYKIFKYIPNEICYKDINLTKENFSNTWNIRKIRDIPLKQKNIEEFNRLNVNENFFNIVDKNNEEEQEERSNQYNIIDDAMVTLESSSPYDYFIVDQDEYLEKIKNAYIKEFENLSTEELEKRSKETLNKNIKYIIEEVVKYYKIERKQNAMPKRVQFIIYKKEKNKIKKYLQIYIFDEESEKYQPEGGVIEEKKEIDEMPIFHSKKDLEKIKNIEDFKRQYAIRDEKQSKFYINKYKKYYPPETN